MVKDAMEPIYRQWVLLPEHQMVSQLQLIKCKPTLEGDQTIRQACICGLEQMVQIGEKRVKFSKQEVNILTTSYTGYMHTTHS